MSPTGNLHALTVHFWYIIYVEFNSTVPIVVPAFRYPLPVDVLAQLQLCHHRTRRRSAAYSHEHLLLPGCLHSVHLRHVVTHSTRWQVGHGEDVWITELK